MDWGFKVDSTIRKQSPASGVLPMIVTTPAVTVNICMSTMREQGVLPVARIEL